MTFKYFFAAIFLLSSVFTYGQTIVRLTSGTKTSIRGLSVVDDSVAWVSGSNGWIASTIDGGATWRWQQLKGYEAFDFRDIEAFSANKAVTVNAGSPAVILLTEDGGNNWREVYRNDSPDIFLDGMDFWNTGTGLIYGDPINGKMQLLKTVDGGRSWSDISDNIKISLAEGEASFAASGTNIRTVADGKCWIATGGVQSRIFYSSDYGQNWRAYPMPIIQGQSSTGPFSMAFKADGSGVVVGGNYLLDTLRTKNSFITGDGGKTWTAPRVNPFGYRSSVELINGDRVIATGTSGLDVSYDGGKTWKNISTEGFHVVRTSKSGALVLLAGSNGRIARIRF